MNSGIRARVRSIGRWLLVYGPLRSLGQFRPRRTLAGYVRFTRDWASYRQAPGAEPIRLLDSYPCVDDWTASTEVDAHYFYQGIWLGQRLARNAPHAHVDVGSDHRVVGMLACSQPITFLDVRPLAAPGVEGLRVLAASILALPCADDDVESLSCLHVIEHVGLGRYGDAIDPLGSRRAAVELARVLQPGGNLYVSLPIGRSRVQFNAHRVHDPIDVLAMFAGLELVEFSAVDDRGRFITQTDPKAYRSASYACGLYWLRKPSVARLA